MTTKHEYHPLEINPVEEVKPLSPKPSMLSPTAELSPPPSPTPQPMGYIPKQGDMTVEEVEEELGMLMERLDFLENMLVKLKKENAKDLEFCVC